MASYGGDYARCGVAGGVVTGAWHGCQVGCGGWCGRRATIRSVGRHGRQSTYLADFAAAEVLSGRLNFGIDR